MSQMIIKLIIPFAVSLLLTLIAGWILVPILRRIKAGQMIREDGPVWHMSKQGTPTMGGLMFIFAITIVCLLFGIKELCSGNSAHLLILVFSLVYAAIGFLDDYEKLKKSKISVLRQSKSFSFSWL